jgi:RNA polymerase sigma factor (sigma-70 family)
MEDIVQNCLLNIVKTSRDRLLKIENWKAFLFWLADKRTGDYLRRAGRRQCEVAESAFTFGEDAVTTFLESQADANPGPDARAGARLLLGRVMAYIDSLPEKNRGIFRLYLQGYKLSEIAEICNLPQAQVNPVIYRLKKSIGAMFPDAM